MATFLLRSFSLFMLLAIGGSGTVYGATGPHANQMVVAANPHAAAAGIEILNKGGSAVDAAIAVELVLGLVEPQSSGIGGGAFMMHYDPKAARGQRVVAFDGREMAPAGATPDMFMDVIRQKKGFYAAVLGGRSVGTPSVVAMMYLAHSRYGKLPWKELFTPAIRLAEKGFKVSPRLHYLIARDPLLPRTTVARHYFFNKSGKAWPVGHVLKNPDYAASLRLIANKGPDGFYKGKLARDIVAAVNNSKYNPGKLSLKDMAGYVAKQRTAICGAYRVWTVCGMPPPSSGGGAVASILGMLQYFDLKAMKPNSLKAVHVILEAERLAYADRDKYMADSDFVPVPLSMFTDPAYLKQRARKISLTTAMGKVSAGKPPVASKLSFADGMTPEFPSTSHFVIVDKWGNMISMTATVESAFGSRVMVNGFILNNEMTDFSMIPERNGVPVANRIVPGKRPRSSMAPTFVLDQDGRVVLTVGTPGGNSIIAYVVQAIINVLDWNMTMQQAVDQPHFLTRGGPVYLEQGTAITALAAPLEKMGHKNVQIRTLNSGLHGIIVHYGPNGVRYEGGADDRREGVVRQ